MKISQRFFLYLFLVLYVELMYQYILLLTAAEIVLSTYSARERLFSTTIGLPLFLVFFFEKWLRQIIVSEALVDLVIDIWVVNILHSWESPSTTTTQPVQTWPFHRRKLKWRHSSATCTLIQINENEQLNYYRILDYMVLYKYIFIWLPIKSITYN